MPGFFPHTFIIFHDPDPKVLKTHQQMLHFLKREVVCRKHFIELPEKKHASFHPQFKQGIFNILSFHNSLLGILAVARTGVKNFISSGPIVPPSKLNCYDKNHMGDESEIGIGTKPLG
jgi:hypothetical protein